MGGAYDGARRFDDSVALWQPDIASADMDLLPEKTLLDARARDSFRNDAYVAGSAQVKKDSVVGTHFLVNAKPATKLLAKQDKFFDPVWEGEFQEEVETFFTLLAESPQCWLDAGRKMTLTEMTRLNLGVFGHGGEAVSTAEWIKNGRPVNTAIQMVDADRLSTPWNTVDSPTLRRGVQMDTNGAPLSYWFRNVHPNDYGYNLTLNNYQWTNVPARKPWGRQMVMHIYDQQRVAQTRGVSSLVSILQELPITKKFRKIQLQSAVVNATYAASIESELPSETVFMQLGGGQGEEGAIKDAIARYTAGYLSAIDAYTKGAKNLSIDGVKIPHLFPGTKLQMRPASQGGPLGTEFEQSVLRYLAAALGISYEQLSKDYSQTNYSSAKAAMAEAQKSMGALKRFVAEKFANFVYRLVLEEAINGNMLSTLPSTKRSIFYTGNYQNLMFDAICGADWIGASRGQIDELKETQAAILRIAYGLSTWEDELGRLGKDWRKVLPQLSREIADLPEQVKEKIFTTNLTPPTVAGLGPGGDSGADNNGGSKE